VALENDVAEKAGTNIELWLLWDYSQVIMATAKNCLLAAGRLGQVSNFGYSGNIVRSSMRQQKRGPAPATAKEYLPILAEEVGFVGGLLPGDPEEVIQGRRRKPTD
jgi:hypothetical protein